MVSNVDFLDYSLAVKPFPFNINSGNKITINTINQYSYCIAERDLTFKQALKNSDILLPDGIGIVKACSYLTGVSINKIAGAEIHQNLLEQLNNLKGKCFYLGSSENTLNKINKRMSADYPFINMAFYSPPFKKDFDDEDINIMVENINYFKPDVLFIGLTAPKQEKLAYLLKDRLDTKVICSIGAVFDFYAGTISRPSQFWIDKNMEWFIRLAKEPKRMWKRYMYFGLLFAYMMAKKKNLIKKNTRQSLIKTY
jgi:N-acetylglucosaminyldiphosphoundecaprenol N-acetyl-beta-D-mannosaminyltransferase